MLEQVTQVLGRKCSVSRRIEQTKNLILEMGRERKKLSCDLEAGRDQGGYRRSQSLRLLTPC